MFLTDDMYSSYLPTTFKTFPGHWGQFSGIFKGFSGSGGSAMETSTRLRHFISTIYCAHVLQCSFSRFRM